MPATTSPPLYHPAISKIHGRGLFASAPISKGTVIGVCATRPAKRHGLHTLTLSDKQVHVTCALRFINHSRSPNVAYAEDLTVTAIRSIRAGEELTHDYGDDWG